MMCKGYEWLRIRISGKDWLLAAGAFWLLGFALLVASQANCAVAQTDCSGCPNCCLSCCLPPPPE